MPGGFIGVDVFFVISGFLITSHLIREASRTGRVKLGAFWAARARRILPASLVTIAATIAATAWLAPITHFDRLWRQALASIFYVQNWILAADSVDYSASENEATAFQHFWSLSVEEQFYLFWPLLVLVALWVVARGALSPGRVGREQRLQKALTVLFGAVVLVSLAYSIFTVSDGQADAYFVTTTRIWELGAGGMLAVIGLRRLRPAWRYMLVYLGLAAIAGSAFLLTNETPFPGLAAIPVILGTVAVILAGTPAKGEHEVVLAKYDPWTFASRLGPAQWIGDRSYSLYLWHFPVIVLWTMAADRKVDYLDIVGMAVVSFVLAHFSYRFIEQPVRRASYFTQSTARSLTAAAVSMLLVAVLTFAYSIMIARAAGNGDWEALAIQARSLPSVGAEAVKMNGEIPTFTTSTAAITPSPLDAAGDRDLVFSNDECVAHIRDDVTPRCTIGNRDAHISVALVGDSHARMYSTALGKVAEDNGWFMQTYLHDSCPFNPVPREIEIKKRLVCTEPNTVVMEQLLADPPDLVITTWSFAHVFVDDDVVGKSAAAGFAEYWTTLRHAGIKVLVLRDIPHMTEDIPDCIAQNYDDPDVCARPRADALIGTALLEEALALAPTVSVADFTDLYCTDQICKSVIGNVLVYVDDSHITDSFALSMITQLETAVDEALATQ